MIGGLKIDEPVVVLAQHPDVGFHDGLVVRVVQFERASVEADEAYLRSEPEISIFIEEKIVYAILGQPVFVGKMLHSVTVYGIRLSQSGYYRQ